MPSPGVTLVSLWLSWEEGAESCAPCVWDDSDSFLPTGRAAMMATVVLTQP